MDFIVEKRTPRFLLLGMPCWGVEQPFHSVALVGGMVRERGWDLCLRDLNIEFYHRADPALQVTWENGQNHIWFSDVYPSKVWQEHAGWFEDYVWQLMDEFKPDMVGFSVNMGTYYFSMQVARFIRQNMPTTPILFGGVDCYPSEKHLALINDCDILCQEESEIALPAYLDAVRQTGKWFQPEVKGFIFRRTVHGENQLTDTGEPELPKLKGKQPWPTFDLLDLSKYLKKGVLPFSFSRGCI